MCGIAGIRAKKGEVDHELVRAMTALMFHRGPIEDGYLAEPTLGLGMRRLSIIDIDGGQQPVFNETGSVAVILNGQIYNYVELRTELQKRGHRFATQSDTEVIVHLYEEMGENFLAQLNGMFAIALWDRTAQRLLLARDRLGVKPLYYFDDDRYFAFASELKSLLRCDFVSRDVDKSALADYLAYLYVPGPRTPLQSVSKLPPGHYLSLDSSGMRIERYWNLAEHCVPTQMSKGEIVDHTRALLKDSVRLRLRSDVPVGAFLSGGLDSSALVAYAAEYSGSPLRTFAVRFEGDEIDELDYAKSVAQKFGTEHHELSVSTDDALQHLPKLIWHLDEPSGDSAIVPSYIVSDFAARDLRVVLSGLGGDELFGGYTRYFDGYRFEHCYRLLPQSWRSGAAGLSEFLPARIARRIRWNSLPFECRYAEAVANFLGPERDELLGEHHDILELGDVFATVPNDDTVNRLLFVDMQTYLPDDILHITDRMSMAVSLEARTPFLDYRLVEFCAGVSGRYKVSQIRRTWKVLLKEMMAPVLPSDVISRPKKGFNAPVLAWMRKLAPVLRRVFHDSEAVKQGLLDRAAVDRFVLLPPASRTEAQKAWLLLILEIWCRVFLVPSSGTKPSFSLLDLAS
jgi:asparagine synthase (glutamine-hydrolysing)